MKFDDIKSKMKNIAVLSSGSDNTGINSAIRAIVRSAGQDKIKVWGINSGFQGLIDDHMKILTSRDVSGKMGKAGCFLGTGRPHGIFTDENIKKMLANVEKHHIEGLIVIGGNTSLDNSKLLHDAGLPVVAVPSTIQDDIYGTDIAIGVDSAVNNIMKCIDKIRTCDSSRERSYLVSVEGKKSGTLAIRSALVSGAEICLIPENPCNDLSIIVKQLQETMKGKTHCVAIISNGWKPGIDELTNYLAQNDSDVSVRETVLGYVQRGGAPTGFDRLLGTKMGSFAYKALIEGNSGNMVAYRDTNYTTVPYSEFVGRTKTVDPHLIDMFNLTK